MKALFHKNKVSWFATAGFIAAVVAMATAMFSGFGSRLGWWHFGIGFTLLRWSVYIAIAATVISLLGIVAARPATGKRGMFRAIIGLMIAAPVIVVPITWRQTAQAVPPIHDITTDTDSPPQFIAIAPLRAQAPNSLEYGGAEIAELQKASYPDVKPLLVSIAPSDVFDAALSTANDMGWKIVAADKENNRIEAIDETFWFGFKDDVVIRILADNEGSKLDIRSVSRVGKSDVGTNADRIRSFLSKLRARLAQGS